MIEQKQELSMQEEDSSESIGSLECAHQLLHEGMEIVFTYDHDKSFLPNPDELMQIELIHKQITGYYAVSLIIMQEMRERAKRWVADEVEKKLSDAAPTQQPT
jgi:hypothetical protein